FSAGADGSGGMLIWPLFGTSNQLLAGLTLSMIAVILLRKGRPVLPVLVPLVFLLVMSVYALIVQLGQFWAAENWFLLVLDVIILIAALWVIVESVAAMNAARKSPPELDEETVSTSAGENRSL
ncbi:TPA: hypothetical protein KJW19_004471, partial [Shigella flexneri]|nr:hypothetical protein [Shigella flexneri]